MKVFRKNSQLYVLDNVKYVTANERRSSSPRYEVHFHYNDGTVQTAVFLGSEIHMESTLTIIATIMQKD